MIDALPRREREIFEILTGLDEATAAQVREAMLAPPSYSAVRTLMSRLEKRGLIAHRSEKGTFVYRCVEQRASIRSSALTNMVRTFFDGSPASAATALLGMAKNLDGDEIRALQDAIDTAREKAK